MLFGVKAGDDDQQQVGPMVATLLGRPCASSVTSFEVGEGVIRCERDVEGGTEVVELDLPWSRTPVPCSCGPSIRSRA